jgi:hypothetical protein
MPGLMEAVKGAVRREAAQLLDKVQFVACKVSVSNMVSNICDNSKQSQLQYNTVAERMRGEAAQLLHKVQFVACKVS